MKKSLRNFALIMVLGFLLLSAGCGDTKDFYNLSPWRPPGDPAFTSFVNSMNSPSKITSWIGSNCSYRISYEKVISPYEFWKTKIGDCSEASALVSYCLHQNGYTTYQTYILYTDDKAHRICIYKMSSGYGYTSFHGNGQCKNYPYNYPDFYAVVKAWDRISTHTVTSYAVYNWSGSRIETLNGLEIINRGIYDGE